MLLQSGLVWLLKYFWMDADKNNLLNINCSMKIKKK